MPGRKQPPRTIQKPLGPGFGFFVGMPGQEPDIAYQVGPAVLGLDPIVPGKRAVGRKVIEIQITGELRPNQIFQYFTRTRGGDVKNAERGRRDASYPVLFAVLFETRFIAAELFLAGNCLGQFFVSIGQRCGYCARTKLGQVPA